MNSDDAISELRLLARAARISVPTPKSKAHARRLVVELRDVLADGREPRWAAIEPMQLARRPRERPLPTRRQVPSQRDMKRAFLERDAARRAA